MVDPHTVVGNPIKAKAILVLFDDEAARRFGSNAATKIVDGEVIEVKYVLNPKSNKRSCYIIGRYFISAKPTKVKELNIRSVMAREEVIVKAVEEPVIVPNLQMEIVAEVVPPNEIPVIVAEHNNNIEVANNLIIPPANAPVNEPVAPVIAPVIPNPEPIINQPERNEYYNEIYGDAVVVKHEQAWYEGGQALYNEINGLVPFKDWSVYLPTGEHMYPGGNTDKNMSRLDVFFLMFPPEQIRTILQCTNIQLQAKGRPLLTRGELIRVLGVMILVTKFEFQNRGDLWSSRPPTPYEHAPNFGRTGVSKNRFDEIIKFLCWSKQPEEMGDMTLEQYRWALVDDFVDNFNNHRATRFIPSDRIYVDESMSRWYGQGGSWINRGLPSYCVIDRKPDNGCEIQSACCGRSVVDDPIADCENQGRRRKHSTRSKQSKRRRRTNGR
jgi:Transposase IS4